MNSCLCGGETHKEGKKLFECYFITSSSFPCFNNRYRQSSVLYYDEDENDSTKKMNQVGFVLQQ